MTEQKKEYVSVVLPTYNRASKVGKAIESVLQQTYPYFELIVVDDGSMDDTEQVVKACQDERVVYYRMAENGGQARARNYGIQMAQYDYIAFEDDDDLWRPQKLERQMEAMLHADSSVGLVYHKLRYDIGGGKSVTLPHENIACEKKSGDIYAQLLWENMIDMPTILVKKECIEAVGGMDETFRCLEDYDFVLRVAKKYHVIFLDDIYLDSGFSDTGVSGNWQQWMIASCTLLQKYKADYLATDTFNHQVEIILRTAERLGVKEKVVPLLEKMLQV